VQGKFNAHSRRTPYLPHLQPQARIADRGNLGALAVAARNRYAVPSLPKLAGHSCLGCDLEPDHQHSIAIGSDANIEQRPGERARPVLGALLHGGGQSVVACWGNIADGEAPPPKGNPVGALEPLAGWPTADLNIDQHCTSIQPRRPQSAGISQTLSSPRAAEVDALRIRADLLLAEAVRAHESDSEAFARAFSCGPAGA
jgi:hypothetical protein